MVNWWRANDGWVMDAEDPVLLPRVARFDRFSWIAGSTVQRTNSPAGPASEVQVAPRHQFPNGRLESRSVVQNKMPNIQHRHAWQHSSAIGLVWEHCGAVKRLYNTMEGSSRCSWRRPASRCSRNKDAYTTWGRCGRTSMGATSLNPAASGGCPDWMKGRSLAMRLRYLPSGVGARTWSVSWSRRSVDGITNRPIFACGIKSDKSQKHPPAKLTRIPSQE